MNRLFRMAVIAGCALGSFSLSHGQTVRDSSDQAYPARPVRLIVPFGAGSGVDIIARLIAAKLSVQWPQAVVVETRAGASGNIGAAAVAKSVPDGYTLLLGNIATHGINPAMFGKKLPFDAQADFAPVILLARTSVVLVVHPSFRAKTMPELIALAKAEPGKFNYASAGTGSGSHMPAELLKLATGIDIVHIPYKGSGDALTALLGGDVQMAFSGPLSVLSFIKSGRVRALAVTSTKRTRTLPEVPTIAETVAPGYEADLWFGVLAVAKTPNTIVAAINAAINTALDAPDVKARMLELDLDAVGGTPEQFATFIKSEIAKWTRIVEVMGIRAE